MAHAATALIDRNDTVVLFADLQPGIADLPLTLEGKRLRAGIRGLATLAEIFGLPVVVTAVSLDGSQPKFLAELDAVPAAKAPQLRTTPKSFADPATRAAIEATGRRTLVISGVAIEVVVSLAALAAVAEGYTVYVVVDACAGLSARSEEAALRRMEQAGVRLTSIPALVGELAGRFEEPATGRAIGVLMELARG